MVLRMARRAKPANMQWLIVVVVMRMRIWPVASLARHALQFAGPDGPGHCIVCFDATRILRPPAFADFDGKPYARRGFRSFSVVLSDAIEVFFSMLFGV